MQGLILYFPSEGGQETIPSAQLIQHPVLVKEGASARRSSSSSSSSSSNSKISLSIEDTSDEELEELEEDRGLPKEVLFAEVEDLTVDEDDSLFRIYWQNRLVPDTKLNKLSFFPEARSWIRHNLNRNWSNRVKCFLFFDANFHNISNNKLKINVDPDLQTWITSKPVTNQIIYIPKNIKESFPRYADVAILYVLPFALVYFFIFTTDRVSRTLYFFMCRWVKKCQDRFDQEFTYSAPLTGGDIDHAHLANLHSKSADR